MKRSQKNGYAAGTRGAPRPRRPGTRRGRATPKALPARRTITLDADVIGLFPDSAAVNEALRLLAGLARRQFGAAIIEEARDFLASCRGRLADQLRADE